MSALVILKSIDRRAKTISLITCIQRYSGLRLKEAKEAVEKVQFGQHVELTFIDEDQASLFAGEAKALGVEVVQL